MTFFSEEVKKIKQKQGLSTPTHAVRSFPNLLPISLQSNYLSTGDLIANEDEVGPSLCHVDVKPPFHRQNGHFGITANFQCSIVQFERH